MLISSILGLFLGYFAWGYHNSNNIELCDDIIDIYYPDSWDIKKLNLQYMRCPYTLNNCRECDKYAILNQHGSRIDPIAIIPCESEKCKIYYLSRKNYNNIKNWYEQYNLVFNYPQASNNKIYTNYEK